MFSGGMDEFITRLLGALALTNTLLNSPFQLTYGET
jgi:hypothetical protein